MSESPPERRHQRNPQRSIVRLSTTSPDPALAAAVVDVLESRGQLGTQRSTQRGMRTRIARRNLTRSAAVAAEIARRVR